MIEETQRLTMAARRGDLSVRADQSRASGAYAEVLGGLSSTVDAILAPVTEARAVLDRLAAHDLRARATGKYSGDHAHLSEALNQTAVALERALQQIATSSREVSTASREIASASQTVAAGASMQAGSLDHATNTLHQVSALTRRTADSATSARELTASAEGRTREGSKAVEDMQVAMNGIRTAADRTTHIIRDIHDIAFQTNLLALNAAIEAARAGDAGLGFAVVAEEVRALALRAQTAARDTEVLVEEMLRQTSEGADYTDVAVKRLSEAVHANEQLARVVDDIAGAAAEQARGVTAVEEEVTKIDGIVHQNAASSEESSAAAEELEAQATELAALAASFRISEASSTRPSAKRSELRA